MNDDNNTLCPSSTSRTVPSPSSSNPNLHLPSNPRRSPAPATVEDLRRQPWQHRPHRFASNLANASRVRAIFESGFLSHCCQSSSPLIADDLRCLLRPPSRCLHLQRTSVAVFVAFHSPIPNDRELPLPLGVPIAPFSFLRRFKTNQSHRATYCIWEWALTSPDIAVAEHIASQNLNKITTICDSSSPNTLF
ncbi:hypothetical protein DEO72_LG3g1050 [Vigna unguiculata]|uniref:Uncharacterized protein n=1 Tax=Vigna unguiculata TaxID=3917 RepID=A0A4D6LD71_VIGUN|nr:hypothetical protein DEO72_LG3g1050 [Vigna unguiculata]